VVLKRLSDAVRDNDPIYGTIQGWGVNQDGKTNGITAPNPQSQTRLQQDVYDRFGIDPGSIQLIEAHGTGTKLGDPIEVEALKASFGKYTQKTAYCALGSVKSNIGHCLTAAGIAGFIKLMLALKHRQQPPTIQFDTLNEHIDLAQSPFFVNRELRSWDVPASERRQAAISSFGFSGTNAHIVVAEHVAAPSVVTATEPAIIVLSARTAEQLQQKVRDLLAFIATAETAPDLAALAYTLQVGRQPMDERLGLVAASLDELAQKLRAYLDGASNIAELSRGHARHNRESVSLLGQDEDIKATIVERWVAQRKLAKLADLWVKGLEWDWRLLYETGLPQRIALPTYPFARERYWAEASDSESTFADSAGSATAMLHPLLHTNTSTLRQQTYRSRFDGSEFFLADHRVRLADQSVEKVLPGVAYLEMARAAVAQAAFGHDDAEHLELRDVVWLRPLAVRERREVSIALLVQDADRPEETLEFRIYSETAAGQSVHCQGSSVLKPAAAAARLDVESLERQMSQSRMEAPQLYQALAAMGLAYGPAHQSLTAIELGERQLLARLSLPATIANSDRHYVLHPSLMDGAIQASVGLMLHGGHLPNRPPVPFAMDSARVLAACSRDMIAWVRYAPGPATDAQTWKLDIDLCDAQATVCVQIRGFALRVLDADSAALPPAVARTVAASEAGAPAVDGERDTADEFAFYRQLVDAIANNEISIGEAVELG
ncbi:type I polyketide synthase, partial [Tahibacter aquaticus]|uniref:polyketide synthase family protein n=1 Tax=Tahibacter aquaticus TaxID=520092 RepID=UPI001414FE54